nr:hypothetical protein Iba_chr12bCG1100 [Ipomoea batatas]GMD64979.1 hypothetical protein Iba_chr12cCG0960 [Ipomoea batatas]GME17168.1 hypothetical protein Iba_scaffold18403CG0320 [Ipomoea batatas]
MVIIRLARRVLMLHQRCRSETLLAPPMFLCMSCYLWVSLTCNAGLWTLTL